MDTPQGVVERRLVSGLVTEAQQHADMRRRNEAAVLRAVLASGPIARTDIARLTQLSAPSVTKVTQWLVKAGFLRELPTAHRPENGRPAVPLALEPRRHVAVGVHIGLLRTTIGVVGLDGSLLEQFALEHNGRLDPTTVLGELVDALDGLWARLDASASVAGIGVAMGGAIDAASGRVLASDALGWQDVPVVEKLAGRVPYPVWLGVNYQALAEAELWFGLGREVDSFLVVFVGNVTGAAIVSDRRLNDGGANRAGAIAHLPVSGYEGISCECGLQGCLEAVAGDVALVRRAEEAGVHCDGAVLRLVELARDGSADAAALLEQRARAVGTGIGPLIDLLDPERVVLAGGVMSSPECLPALREAALAVVHQANLRPADIVPTTFGPASLVVCSAALVLRSVFDNPAAFTGPTQQTPEYPYSRSMEGPR